jgi:hypothetical protein
MSLVLAGNTSGATTVQATDAVTATITLPSATDTLVGKATTDTLTNKTLTLPVVGTTIGVGNATPSTSGAGITFPATQSASTDANTLDDYEEGTWTPTITFGGGSTGLTYTSQVGRYTKIGNLVTAFCYIAIANKGSSTGAFLTGGLPFANSGTSAQYTCCAIWTASITNGGSVAGYLNPNAVGILAGYTSTGGSFSTYDNTHFATGSELMFNITYRVN